MKTPSSRRQARKLVAAITLSSSLPWLMGGCPEFRNSTVDVMDAAARSILLGDIETEDAFRTASRGVFDGALDLFFNSLRSDNLSR